MNLTDTGTTMGQTGPFTKSDSPDPLISQESDQPSYIQIWGKTGRFDNAVGFEGQDTAKERSDAALEDEHQKSRELVISEVEGNIRQLTLHIIEQCEEEFLSGLITGRDELDTLNHVFSLLQNGIPLELIDKIPDLTLAQTYFDRVKIIVQTYVEYLHFVRGIDWHKLKSFLANLTIAIDKSYVEDLASTQNDRMNLKLINSFLPDLISVLKDKNDLTGFTNDLITLIRYMRENNGVNLVTLFETTALKKMAGDFVEKYLNCNSEFFEIVLKKIHSNLVLENSSIISQRVGQMERVPFFNLIRILNDPNFIGNSMDYFINTYTRGIRLKVVLTQADLIFKKPEQTEAEKKWGIEAGKFSSYLSRPISTLQADSRRSIYQTQRYIESQDVKNVLERELSPRMIEEFNNRMFTLISNIPEFPVERMEQNNFPPQVLKRLFKGEKGLAITHPEAFVEFFCRLFESAIIYVDNEVFESTGMTISKKDISTLFYAWKNELEKLFEQNRQESVVSLLESLDYYFSNHLSRLEKSQADVLLHPIELYAQNLSQRLKNKIAILDVDRSVSVEQTPKQFVLAILSSGIRSHITSSEVYYAETLEQIIADIFSYNPTDDSLKVFMDHIIGTISQNAWSIFGTRDKTPIANILTEFLKMNKRLLSLACKYFDLDIENDLDQKILEKIKKSPTRQFVEA